MKALFVLLSSIIFLLVCLADIPGPPKLLLPTNAVTSQVLTQGSGTNVLENLLRKFYREFPQAVNGLSRFGNEAESFGELLESTKRLMEMYKGASNLLTFTYTTTSNQVSILIANPVMSKKREGEILGGYYILYPEGWENRVLAFKPLKKSSYGPFVISYSVGTNQQSWKIHSDYPFTKMSAADITNALEQVKKITDLPLQKIKFDLSKPPVLIMEPNSD